MRPNGMSKGLSLGAAMGAALGFALSAYAHTANGYLTGPVILLALVAATAATVITGILIMIGKRGVVLAVASFSVSMVAALLLVPLIWPYPVSSPPVRLR